MKVTKIESPLVTKNELNGIIYMLKNSLKINPIKEKLVIPSSSSNNNKASVLVNWDSFSFSAGDKSLPWVQLSFPKGYIIPTAYSMRGSSNKGYTYSFPTSWDVYGIKEGDENDESKWKLLATNKSSESSYCNPTTPGGGCNSTSVGTFTLQPMQATEQGFKHLRWRQKTSSYDGATIFPISGIDVYGTLFTFPRKCTVYYRCSSHSLITVVLLGNLMNK